nr:hypothetical protein [Tanacetum cinerariifolium]GEY09361.1 hypothetical protein [Tanacetum cinerariifolium]
MAQPQRPDDVHKDDLCPPNKRYALMDANKKIDLDNPLYPNERKIMANIIQNHPLRLSVAASLSVPWIYLGPRDKYHNLEEDVMVKNIFNSRKHKDDVGMKIPNVPTTQSQPIESTQGTHRTLSAPRSPNPKTDEGESSALRKSTKSHDELEARQNVKKVKEHLIAEEIEKLVEGAENVEKVKVNSSTLRQDDTQTIPGTRPSVFRPRDQDDPRDDAHPKGENIAKRQKTSEHETFMFGESSFEIPYEKVSQELVDEMSHTVDEAKLHKVVDEMLRQRCTSGDEHQYHIDQMQNFLKNDIVKEAQDLIVMSLYKFPAVIFLGDDIEERTSRWIDKSIVIWKRVHDFQLGVESYQQKVNLTATTITFPGIEKFKVFSIVSEPLYGIIYKNIKK